MNTQTHRASPLGRRAATEPHAGLRRARAAMCHRMLAGLMAAMLVISGCSSSGTGETAEAPETTPLARVGNPPDRSYTAEWIVDAEAIGKEGPGFPYKYVEIVDDATGRFLALGPQHLALQNPETVVFCAGVWQNEPRCASTDRPGNTPNILAIGLDAVRTWHPEELYEVADFRRMQLVADSQPASWNEEASTVGGIPVDCFRFTDAETNTPTGLSLCYTADENRLLASVDMNGDDFLEVFLQRYELVPDEAQLELNFDVIDDTKLYEQLLVIFPDVPITSTDEATDVDGNPIPATDG